MSKRTRQRLDPVDVIRDRVRPGAADLCRLIRAANPTGVALPAAERSRRYEQKNRLQSLLLRRFPDDVEVIPDPREGEGVVLLRHRPSGELASHAVLGELDEDARSWAQKQVDLGAHLPTITPETTARRTPSRAAVRELTPTTDADAGAEPEELLASGRGALDDYDYDLARALFSRALKGSGGAPRPAEALLDLLVEHLGADADALVLADDLPQATLGHPGVRRLVGLAAARAGDVSRAAALVTGDREPRAAEVLVELAKTALRKGDPESALRFLAGARERAPEHASLADMHEQIERLLAAKQKPLEERLLRLVAEDRLDEAEAAARGLGSTPPSTALQRALSVLGERRRHVHARAVVAAAERAMASGDFLSAVGLLRKALVDLHDSERESAARLLGLAESSEQERSDEVAATAARKLLADKDPAPAYLAYLELSPSARMRLRAVAAEPDLALLDATGASGTGTHARAVVAAVMALRKARRVVDQDPDGAARMLDAHTRTLANVPEAAELLVRAAHVRDAKRRAKAKRDLEEARAILVPLGFDRARAYLATPRLPAHVAALTEKTPALLRAQALLDEPTIAHLDESDRRAAQELHLMTGIALGALAFHAETRRLLMDGDVVRVRAVAGDYVRAVEAAGAPPGYRETFETGIDTLIQGSFAVSVAGDGATRLGDRGLARAVVTDGAMPMQRPWAISIHPTKCAEASLRGGCEELIVVQSIGRFIFVRRIDVRSDPAVLISCAVLRTRTRSDLVDVAVRGDRAMAVGDFGAALALEIEDSRVLAWRNAEAPETGPIPSLRLPWVVTSSAFAVDLSQVWIVENPLRRGPRLRVLSAETLRTTIHEERVLSAQTIVHPVPRAFPCPASARDAAPKSHAMALVGNPAGTVDFRTGDGQALSKGRLAADVQPRSVAPFPGGGLFGLIDAQDAGAFQVVRLVPASVVVASPPIAGRADDAVGAVTDERRALIFVLFEEDDRERQMLALDARDPTQVTRLYGVRVPYRTALTRDQATGTAALRIVLPTGLHVIPLGAEPPEIPADPEPFSMLRVPFCQMLGIRCQRPASPRRHVVEALLHLIENPSKAHRMVEDAVARGDTDAVYDIACVFELYDDYPRAAEMNARVADRFPRNPWLALQAARLLANVGLWPRVLIALDGVTDSAFDGPDARHFAHLLGFALMWAGRHDEAVDVLERGLSHLGPCALQPLLGVASRPEKALDAGPDARALRELARRVSEADRCLAAANPRGALDHVDHVLVWEARELQSGARLARAMLSAGEDGPPDHRLRKLLALATFVEVHEEKTGRQREVLLRDRWNGHDLAALAKEAHAWIESFFELEEHPSWRLVPSNGE